MTTESKAADLGSVTCSLRGSVQAGSDQTCVLTYTAGFAGIDDTGSLKIVVRYATDSGEPQFDDPTSPNYVTAVASNNARLKLRYDVKDNVRPWGKTIHVKVLQGYLRQGDTITVTMGDKSKGSVGWRMQTFLEETFEIRVLVDRYATYVYEQVPNSPTFRIVAGLPVKCVAVAPPQVRPGKGFTIRYKTEDAWGNPTGRPRKLKHSGFEAPGRYSVEVTDEVTGLKSETNPIIVRDEWEYDRYWADLHGQSEETVGTNSIESYFRFARDYAFLDACAHQGNDFQITDAFWQTIQQTTRDFYKPGQFVTFPGWEWSGNTALGGDRNVLYKEEGGLITRSSRALVSPDEAVDDCSHTSDELFDRLEKQPQDVMTIAHVGGRYADLNSHREGLETAVEVHSAWGTFEWMLEDAFSRSYRVAIVANSDGHKGRPGASYPGASTFGSYGGLTCILAEKLDRDSVWNAYQQRRVYGTTGARIFLEFDAGETRPMGSIIKLKSGEPLPELRIAVEGTAALEQVELRNGMRVLKRFRTEESREASSRIKLLWQGAEVRGRGRQVRWDGELRVQRNSIESFQPINFHNCEQTCDAIGSNRLQWRSLTTGGVAGVICELSRQNAGTLQVTTAQKSFELDVADITRRQKSFRAGGLGKQIAAYRLPPADGPRGIEVNYQLQASELNGGDNPIYICVVQEDGQMAWSSPIYIEKVD